MSYFRIQHPNRPDILNPQNQTSSSWNDLGDDDRPGVAETALHVRPRARPRDS